MTTKPTLEHNIAQTVLDRFGGEVPKMAEITGHPAPRIHAWLKSRTIHDRYRAGLLKIAREKGIPHTPWDYIAHLADIAA